MILFTVTLKRINYQGGEGFPCWLSGKESTAIQEAEETWGWSLGWEVSLKEGMATHSSILAWKFPWIGVPENTVYGVAESWTQLKQISTHTQGAKDSYSENWIMLKKETEDDTKRWKDIWCSYIRRLNTVTRTILSKAIYKSKPVPVKILKAFFTELE